MVISGQHSNIYDYLPLQQHIYGLHLYSFCHAERVERDQGRREAEAKRGQWQRENKRW